MKFTLCAGLIVLLMSEVVASQAFLCKEASLSCPVITYNHRRLKGFTLKTFHSASLISCSLLCQRDPRCVSTNFRKVFKSEGTCELNDRGALLTEKGNELEYDEEAIYTQFYDTKVTKKTSIKYQEEFEVVIDSSRHLFFVSVIFPIKSSYFDDRCENFPSVTFFFECFYRLVLNQFDVYAGKMVIFHLFLLKANGPHFSKC